MSRKSIIRVSLRLRQIIDLLVTDLGLDYLVILLLFERKVLCNGNAYAYVAGATNDNTGASNYCFL